MLGEYSFALEPGDSRWPPMITATDIPGLLIYERPTFPDDRGFFREPLEKRDLETVLGRQIPIVQWNHSRSIPGVVRGFHAEPWEKMVYVARGRVLAAIVDLRLDSPVFGKVVTIELGEHNRRTLFLPFGMGNSFCVISDEPADYIYLVTAYYDGQPSPAVSVLDPMLTRQFGGWPVTNPIISDKDRSHPTLVAQYGDRVDLSIYPWLHEEK
jgi:dTDP-4-dehydrorhamnose 3,5-epimerase